MNKKTVKAGTYVITIHDRSSIHNFHLTGPGINKKTSVPAVGTTKWTVKLKKGTYRFVCDPTGRSCMGSSKSRETRSFRASRPVANR